jgi:archaellum component FlaC
MSADDELSEAIEQQIPGLLRELIDAVQDQTDSIRDEIKRVREAVERL